ncbi:MAG: hypothetical protein WBN88_04745 [Anderseniella sp.]
MNEFEFQKDARLSRLFGLLKAAFNPPAGKARIIAAIVLGVVCHTMFAVAVISMIVAMWFGWFCHINLVTGRCLGSKVAGCRKSPMPDTVFHP